MTVKRLVATSFLFLVLLPLVHAQYVWKVTQLQQWKVSPIKGKFVPSLSCNGKNCTAIDVFTDSADSYSYRFLHSVDGGKSWEVQNPAVPWYFGAAYRTMRIQQIDSLNIVAVGDSGLILRTFDAGAHWEKQDAHTVDTFWQVHFADPLNGIATIYTKNFLHRVYITSDGGKQWDTVRFDFYTSGLLCHCFGAGKFRLWRGNYIETTEDNWKTVKESAPIIDFNSDQDKFSYDKWNISGRDTILVLGMYNPGDNLVRGAFRRSFDGGDHWEAPYIHDTIEWYPQVVSPIGNETVIASGLNRYTSISTDHGASWKRHDSIEFEPKFGIAECVSIDWAGEAPVLSAWVYDNLGSKHILARGEVPVASVPSLRNNSTISCIPNPAASSVIISTGAPHATVVIYDMLAREVRQGLTDSDGKISFDLYGLPKGLYSVATENQKATAKFMVVGE